MKNISVIIPVYNEEKNIVNFIETFYQSIKNIKKKIQFRLVFCDDGSTDSTWDIIKSVKKKYNRILKINGIKLLENYGKDYAILNGIKYSASDDAIITIDGDLQHPINLIPKMVSEWIDNKYSVVHFIRENKNYSKIRIFISFIFNKFFNFITNFKLQPGITDFKLLDKKIFRKLINTKKQIFFYRGEISKFNENEKFIESKINKRTSGESSFSIKSLLVLSLNYITIYSYSPLYFISIFGTLLFIIGIVMLFMMIIGFFPVGLLQITLIFNSILFGITIIFIGILSFYLRNIFLNIVQTQENRIDEKI